LRDPHLTLDGIALALNCSKRHLHNAFAGEEDSLAHYILRRRLQACMRDLKNPTLAHRHITDIALSWGFNSSAHFSRVFREHAGLSPSDFRQAASRHNVA
jgi:AraC-like DNA-binding protein